MSEFEAVRTEIKYGSPWRSMITIQSPNRWVYNLPRYYFSHATIG
jgi:hypothetical protein